MSQQQALFTHVSDVDGTQTVLSLPVRGKVVQMWNKTKDKRETVPYLRLKIKGMHKTNLKFKF